MPAARDSEEIAGIRAAVRALCDNFRGEYWRKLDRERAYPAEFVAFSMNHLQSPMHSAAIRMRSAFMPARM